MSCIIVWLIQLYQKYISPLKGVPSCRFQPTCSSYAVGVYTNFGFVRGTLLTVWRILRCNPFSEGGDDPVPERFMGRYKKIK